MEIHILGNGAMASALAFGLKDKFDITIVGRNEAKMSNLKNQGFKTEIYGKNYDITDKNIILAFKPYALNEMAKILSGNSQICISVLAGVCLENLQIIKSNNYAVCMPNIAAYFKTSTTPYFTTSLNLQIHNIISEFGEAIKLENESDLRVAGVISGCVPAFLAIVAESLQNGGVKEGLKKEISANLVNGVFKSSAKLLESMHPAILKEKVCSPAGTTIEGVIELENCGIRSAFINAVSKSANKFKNK